MPHWLPAVTQVGVATQRLYEPTCAQRPLAHSELWLHRSHGPLGAPCAVPQRQAPVAVSQPWPGHSASIVQLRLRSQNFEKP